MRVPSGAISRDALRPASPMSSIRLWTKNTWPPRASSRLIASPSSAASQRQTKVRIASRSAGGVAMIEISRRPAHRHLQRARDRRRGQRQHVDLRAQLLEPLLVADAEALLLVDDQQAEVLEPHVARQQPVRADDDVELPVGQRRHRLLLLGLGAEARQHGDAHREVGEAAPRT